MDMTLYKRCIEARDGLLKKLGSGGLSWGRITAIAIVLPDTIHYSKAQQCHAGLEWEGYGQSPKGGLAVVNGLLKPRDGTLYEDEALLFLDWLLNRSPYASTFVTKSAHEALLTKMTISRGDTPSNLMAAGMVASRRLWEYAFVARVFCDLVKVGVNENLAFYLAHIAQCKFDGKGNLSWTALTSGHCSMNPGVMGCEEVNNFINCKVVKPNKNYCEDSRYGGYDKMFGSCKYDKRLSTWVHKNFPYSRVKEGGAVNPFAKAAPGGDSCKYEEAIKTMGEWWPTLMEHIKEGAK